MNDFNPAPNNYFHPSASSLENYWEFIESLENVNPNLGIGKTRTYTALGLGCAAHATALEMVFLEDLGCAQEEIEIAKARFVAAIKAFMMHLQPRDIMPGDRRMNDPNPTPIPDSYFLSAANSLSHYWRFVEDLQDMHPGPWNPRMLRTHTALGLCDDVHKTALEVVSLEDDGYILHRGEIEIAKTRFADANAALLKHQKDK